MMMLMRKPARQGRLQPRCGCSGILRNGGVETKDAGGGVDAYMSFLAVSLLPVIGEKLVQFDSDTDREWYGVLFLGPMLYVVGPMVQILGLVALRAQAREIKSRSSETVDALSMRGLVAQAAIFLLVGISFVFRIRVPSEELDEHLIVNLRMWYWTVGWATINNLIFTVAQGVLAWIAWRHKHDGGDLSERSALLE
jgi:hypothetical protein